MNNKQKYDLLLKQQTPSKSLDKQTQSIKPITLSRKDLQKLPKSFATLDIETISLNILDNLQIPILISTTLGTNTYLIQIDILKLKIFVKDKNIEGINNLVLDM